MLMRNRSETAMAAVNDGNALLAAAVAGEPTAINQLITHLANHLHAEFSKRSRPRGLGPSRSNADLVQDTLIDLQAKLPAFQGSSFDDLCRWANAFYFNRQGHRIKNHCRRNSEDRKEQVWSRIRLRLEAAYCDFQPEHAAITREECERAKTALEKLEFSDQFVIRLRVIDGLKAKEIAKATGASPAAARKRYQRAIQRLQLAYSYDGTR